MSRDTYYRLHVRSRRHAHQTRRGLVRRAAVALLWVAAAAAFVVLVGIALALWLTQ